MKKDNELITEYKGFDIFEDRTPQKTVDRILSVGHGVSEGGEIEVKYNYYADYKGTYNCPRLNDNNLESLKRQIDKFNARMRSYGYKPIDEELIKESKTKDESGEAKEFANQYMKNVTENKIKVMCPKCNMRTAIYSEHLGRAYCEKCDVLLKVVDMV